MILEYLINIIDLVFGSISIFFSFVILILLPLYYLFIGVRYFIESFTDYGRIRRLVHRDQINDVDDIQKSISCSRIKAIKIRDKLVRREVIDNYFYVKDRGLYGVIKELNSEKTTVHTYVIYLMMIFCLFLGIYLAT